MKIDIFNDFKAGIFDGEYFYVLLILEGHLNLRTNGTVKSLEKNTFTILPVKIVHKILKKSISLKFILMSFTPNFIVKNSIGKPPIAYFEFFISNSPVIKINAKEAKQLTNLFKTLKHNNSKRRHIFQKQVLTYNFNSIIYEIAGLYFRQSRQINIRQSRKENLVMNFFRILEENCRREHSVKFYADSLFITAGHLNKIVKGVTQKTVKQFIEEAIILEAKILLQNNELTISIISDELGFSNPSFFSNFFKSHFHMTPSKYRKSLLE